MKIENAVTSQGIKVSVTFELLPEAFELSLGGSRHLLLDSEDFAELKEEAMRRLTVPSKMNSLLLQDHESFRQAFGLLTSGLLVEKLREREDARRKSIVDCKPEAGN